MVDSVPVLNATKREDTIHLLPDAPILSSEQSGWSNLFFAYFHHPAFIPEGEFCFHHHGLAISETAFAVERRTAGTRQQVQFAPREMALYPANVPYRTAWHQDCKFMTLILTTQLIEQSVQDLVNPDRLALTPTFQANDPVIYQIALALKADLEAGSPLGCLYGDSFATALAVHLVKNYSNLQPRIQDYADGLSKRKLRQVLEFIQTDLDRDIKLSKLAVLAGMSQYHFCRLFKQSMGVTPHQYVIGQRIERAKQLLVQSELSIVEVALLCGFNGQSHLTQLFHRQVGMTPKAYRDRG